MIRGSGSAVGVRSPICRLETEREPMRLRAALLAAAGLLQVGCYNYLPLRRSSLAPTRYLAITLTDSGSDELAPYLGPDVLVVRGRYLGPTERGLTLAVESVESRRGDIARWAGESVVVPGEFVRGVEERQVSRSKTFLLAGASVVGFVVAYAAFGPGSSGEAPRRTGPGPSGR
jgi:hypothetical protein